MPLPANLVQTRWAGSAIDPKATACLCERLPYWPDSLHGMVMSKISPVGLRHLAALPIVLMATIRPGAAAAADLPTPADMPSSMNAPPS